MAAIMDDHYRRIFRYRMVLGFFILALVVSGVTAFPLLGEMRVLVDWLGLRNPEHMQVLGGAGQWILTIEQGLRETYAVYPWVAYGTDWLAFAHIIIAVFFIGPLINPVRNIWVLQAGLIACFLIIPLALICGAVRGIPLGWRLIDCSFGIFGALPLLYCLKLTRRMELAEQKAKSASSSFVPGA